MPCPPDLRRSTELAWSVSKCSDSTQAPGPAQGILLIPERKGAKGQRGRDLGYRPWEGGL